MQRVSLERFALVFPRHTLERSRARDIEQRHHREQAHSQQFRLDVHFVEEQAAKGFPDDVKRGQQQQARLHEGRKAFHLGVAVGVVGVGGLVGDAHRQISNNRRDQVETRVQRLRKNAQAAGGHREEHLERHQQHRRSHRGQRRDFLLAHSFRSAHARTKS